nr:IS5 family transposase [Octadecabacter arcticus]
MMPHKFNASRRHKFEKKRQKVTNWRVYNEGLRQRGDVTIWLSPEVADKWLADKRQTPGGQPTYSDMAISVCLTLGMAFKQPLRQTQGLVGSLARLMGLDVSVPDFSTLSRRGAGLSMPEKSKAQRAGPIELVVDSTGLKIFGEGEWLEKKHILPRLN